MTEPKVKVVCLGDSITWGFPYGPEYSWVHLVSKRYGLEMINRGINGDTTEGMLLRFKLQVASQNPSHVVILGGANDIIIRESLDRIQYNLEKMVEESQIHGITPVMGLPIPLGWAEPERRMSRLRRWIREYVEKRGISLIDFASAFFLPETGEIRYDLLLDGGHPTTQGYAAMAEKVEPDKLGWLPRPSSIQGREPRWDREDRP
ncbi:MAG: SGNH/GDSL hydrolase family protein [Syntrophomonadaceae bacterium]|nr:SGNH/GDSL hydrolase family protein [Syntrophomonadaceae bacterium]